MTRKQKKSLARIMISALCLVALLIFKPDVKWYFELILWLVPYLIIGYDVLLLAARGLIHGQLLDENFLMAIATVGAIVLAVWGRGDYLEAVAVMLFYQMGELFQSIALGKSRRSISALMEIRPDQAVIEKDGELITLSPEEVKVGSIMLVNPGERVAIDGEVLDGVSDIDVSALTGESLPRTVEVGDEILSASVNMTSPLKIRTTKPYGESAVARILDLVENANSHKSREEKFISKFAKIYTPSVCAAALLLAIVPPLISMWLGVSPEWSEWIYRALSFLVISCPCALVISIPMGFFASLGGNSRKGILIKGSNYIESLSRIDCVALDKTGTLTKGILEVSAVVPTDSGVSKAELLEYAALAESASSHPIAKAILRAYGRETERGRVENIKEISGCGVVATIDGKEVSVGNRRLVSEGDLPSGAVLVSVDGRYCGYISLADSPKENARDAIRALKRAGIKKVVMLTGDTAAVAEAIGREVGVDEVKSELLPEDKVSALESLISKGYKVAFAGDGINDSPVLARADVGIAMGGIGSDAATAAADVVITDDDISKISEAIRLSRKCMRVARVNIVFSVGVKLLCLLLTALGIAGMELAIFADVGVMILAVLNAMRCLY
ncbi:MAG: cadmium-translocating P-type ATPase [Clostridia bacterium]|nr:cadmium-translocating P-type ATPase [Clostridia bacterium]